MLFYEREDSVFKRGIFCNNSDCAVDTVAAIPAFARAGKIDWTTPNFLY